MELTRNGVLVRIEVAVARLLFVLLQDAGQLVTKGQLIARVWDGRAISDNVITVTMSRLRKTLEHGKGERAFIVTSHGRGYRFVRPVTRHLVSQQPSLSTAMCEPARGTPPFVGREAILARLRAGLAAASSGEGSLCLLLGEAGIGKTRAVELLAAEAREAGAVVAWSYCQDSDDAPPLWPAAQLVRQLVAASGACVDARAPTLRWLLAQFGAPPDAPDDAPPCEKFAVFEAVMSCVLAAGAGAPVVLILDDLHRADAASLELLRYMTDRVARLPLLLVATLRKSTSETRGTPADLAHLLGHRNATRLRLGRLSEESVATYLAALLPEARPEVTRAIWTKSEGNPFFMVELARELVDASRVDLEHLTVPDAALDLVRPRVRALNLAAHGALSQAAVLGRSFELSVLATVSGTDLPTLMTYLDDALASELIVAAPDSVTAFAFGHELLRQILYDELPPSTRRALHLRVGEVMARRSLEGGGVPAAVLAHHYYRALPDCPIGETVRHCSAAAREAANVFAYADSLRLLRQARDALALIPEARTETRLALLLWHAVAARICAAPEFERLSDELARLARTQQSGKYIAHAGFLRDLHAGFPALAGARDMLEEALASLPREDLEMRGSVTARLATSGPLAFNARASSAQLELALALAHQSQSPRALFSAHAAELYLHGGPGDERGLRAEASLGRLCERHPDRLTPVPVLLELHRAIRAYQQGQLAEVHSTLERAAARCQRVGNRELLWHVQRFKALRALSEDGLRHGAALRSLHRRARVDCIVASELLCVHDEVVVLGDALEPERARRVLGHLLDDPPNVWSMKVRALYAGGLHDQAQAALTMLSARRLDELPRDRDYLGTLGSLARVAAGLGQRSHAEALYAQLEPYEQQLAVHVAFHCEGTIAELLGHLALLLGRSADATRHFETAAGTSQGEAR